jgi:hypothetical protein
MFLYPMFGAPCKNCSFPVDVPGHYCKTCRNERNRLKYWQSPEARQQVIERCREYIDKNRQTVYARNRKNKEWLRRLRPMYHCFMNARSRAKRNNIPFNVTYEDLLPLPTVCPVLGIKLDYAAVKANDECPSLDKIIPALGYIKGNVRVISYRANKLKNDANPEELKKVLDYCLSEWERVQKLYDTIATNGSTV